jgi:hypothetical protein
MSQQPSSEEQSTFGSALPDSDPGDGAGTVHGDLPVPRVEVGYYGTGPAGRVVITEIGHISRHVLELTPDNADAIAASIVKAAGHVRSGLILPGSNGATP